MPTYHVKLESLPSESFRCVRAANSLDIDSKSKSIHEFKVEADLESPYQLGLILGASGSGKTTLARKIFGEDCLKTILDPSKAIMDQLPDSFSYDQSAEILSGVGLTSVPCWIRPVGTLSNGQKARAEAALAMTIGEGLIVLDEWTSVVDRTVAKVMSHCVQKFARRSQKRVVLISCHYDIQEWLNPDWIIDCNEQKFIDRRLLQPGERIRKEELGFEIRPTSGKEWGSFSKYHYLSSARLGGRVHHFGLFQGANQIGYAALANYVPWRDKSKPMIVHATRIVIHPDYAGFGLGIKFVNELAKFGIEKQGYRVMCKMSSIPLSKLMTKDPNWQFLKETRQIGLTKAGKNSSSPSYRVDGRKSFRTNVKTFMFEYLPRK